MWSIRRPTPAALDALLASCRSLSLSYPEEGMSRRDESPSGYGREHHEVELDVDFEAAREALATFATHRLPYLFVYPDDARVALGRDVVVCARLGPVWSINPCRVVYVESSDERYGYGYGTLPGHAEHGEERFSVRRSASGRTLAETTAFARPQDVLARMGSPIAHQVQRRIKVDYMRALARGA